MAHQGELAAPDRRLGAKTEGAEGPLRSRRSVLKNRERTNRLLMLMQLELNRLANVDSYSRAIRQWLQSRPGMPQRRRSIEDPKGHPSLRD